MLGNLIQPSLDQNNDQKLVILKSFLQRHGNIFELKKVFEFQIIMFMTELGEKTLILNMFRIFSLSKNLIFVCQNTVCSKKSCSDVKSTIDTFDSFTVIFHFETLKSLKKCHESQIVREFSNLAKLAENDMAFLRISSI